MFILGLFFISSISSAFAQATTYGHCAGPVLLNSTTLQIGPNQFLYEKTWCQSWVNVTVPSNSTDSATSLVLSATGTTSDLPSPSPTDTTSDTTASTSSLQRRGFFDLWPLCIFFHTCRPYFFPPPYYPQQPPPPPPPRDVCGAPCVTSCNDNVGQLPPVTDDCQTIQNSIQILTAQLATTFSVASDHQETLSFGTCTIFFENLGKSELEYCWTGLSNNSALAGAACFPPVHPPFSEGLCTAYDGTWSVGAAHS